MTAPLAFAKAREWRAWLEAHYRNRAEALLFISKKATPGGIHYEEALEEALCFGWIDGRVHAHDAHRFLVRFTPRKAESIWSESNHRRVERLIEAGRMAPAGLAGVETAKARGTWDDALRPSQVPSIPSDLKAALRAEPKAWANFQAWGKSYRAACVHWVTSAKKEETRKRHIRRIVLRARQDRRPGIEGF